MYKPSIYLVVTYFLTYLPTHETYFLQNWLPSWNQILTQLRFIHNWIITDIQWTVCWWVLVHSVCTGNKPILQVHSHSVFGSPITPFLSFRTYTYLPWTFYVNIHLTLSYCPFNIGCHLGWHLDFHLTLT
jgi:hypothetical protein